MPRDSIYQQYIPGVTSEPENNEHAYWFIFRSNKILLNNNCDNFRIPFARTLEDLNISPVRTQYLGLLQGHQCYSVEVASDAKDMEAMSFKDIRSLYGTMNEDIFLLAGRALQIVTWDQTHQCCGRCGLQTMNMQGERAKICPKCGHICYPRISPAVITAIIKDNKILLAHAGTFPGNMYSIIAGFVEPGETLEDCIKREIMEEVGIRVKNIKYFGSQPWPFPNSLMIGFTAEYESGEISVDGVEISDAGWYAADNLPELPTEISISREIIDWFKQNYAGIIT